MADEFTRQSLPLFRRGHYRTVLIVAAILIAAPLAWPYVSSIWIPLAIFVLLALIVLHQLFRFQSTRCPGCGQALGVITFEPHAAIEFRCNACKTIWETGFRHSASDDAI